MDPDEMDAALVRLQHEVAELRECTERTVSVVEDFAGILPLMMSRFGSSRHLRAIHPAVITRRTLLLVLIAVTTAIGFVSGVAAGSAGASSALAPRAAHVLHATPHARRRRTQPASLPIIQPGAAARRL